MTEWSVGIITSVAGYSVHINSSNIFKLGYKIFIEFCFILLLHLLSLTFYCTCKYKFLHLTGCKNYHLLNKNGIEMDYFNAIEYYVWYILLQCIYYFYFFILVVLVFCGVHCVKRRGCRCRKGGHQEIIESLPMQMVPVTEVLAHESF